MIIFNTLNRRLEKFETIKKNKVLFYQCGPTVYFTQHIGNLRAAVLSDLIRRTLIYLNYHVVFVRNYTDVGHLTSDQDYGEDKMEKGAKNENKTPDQIAQKYIKIFENDIKALNVLKADHTPRASRYIKQMQEMIQTLLDRKYAYVTDLAVIYDVSKFPEYTRLNHQKIDFLKKGAGKGTVEDPQKRNAADFNLWVFKKGVHKNALQTWDSPWGEGFPGWHIECSAMIKALLGNTIDVHMGGVEHIPVHHTNEIAQSEAANASTFVNYWIHNEHLLVNNEKMAKSKGTGLNLKEIVTKGFDPLELRYFFLGAHYRSKQNFTYEALEASSVAFAKLKDFIYKAKLKTVLRDISYANTDFHSKFTQYISNDFQIPQALSLVWDVVKSSLSDATKLSLLLDFDKVLGLGLDKNIKIDIPQEITDLAEKRIQAKQKGNFNLADSIRNEIEKKGYLIEDSKKGYSIKKR